MKKEEAAYKTLRQKDLRTHCCRSLYIYIMRQSSSSFAILCCKVSARRAKCKGKNVFFLCTSESPPNLATERSKAIGKLIMQFLLKEESPSCDEEQHYATSILNGYHPKGGVVTQVFGHNTSEQTTYAKADVP